MSTSDLGEKHNINLFQTKQLLSKPFSEIIDGWKKLESISTSESKRHGRRAALQSARDLISQPAMTGLGSIFHKLISAIIGIAALQESVNDIRMKTISKYDL